MRSVFLYKKIVVIWDVLAEREGPGVVYLLSCATSGTSMWKWL